MFENVLFSSRVIISLLPHSHGVLSHLISVLQSACGADDLSGDSILLSLPISLSIPLSSFLCC